MTLEEAKEFYFRYYGFAFHMDREEPAKYSSFKMLGVGEDILKEWDEELLDGLFTELRSDPGRIWICHENILRIIRRGNCDAEKHLAGLLWEMENMEDLDLPSMTLIIENMAGRNEPLNDGGVYLYRSHPDLAVRMNAVMERLIAACRRKCETNDRFEKAVNRYGKACSKWITSV